ncbi:MAG: hypothetical protein P0Y49_02955 [Candidatus Pedobacter colombiensis]|uniref:Uncharacterized protein n=1 Tax=Candidatus Pedobacter colombiensis TaxID=3121371 RepID=A0AAJ5W7Q8_9SPHI|nr:hypothetical protein [Pedobacter sp.]WEK20108.1 MAG: hypothetical protein P0Y49_02955 [Pedobacter sp.]
MDNKVENNDWKKEAPTLAGLSVYHPFSVPEEYFEDLTFHISSAIYLEKMRAEVDKSGFTIPANYFNELSTQLNSELVKEKIKAVMPESNDYTVPTNYFEQLQSNILSKTINEVKSAQSARVVRLWHSKLLKYASAACFVILSTVGFYFYQQHIPAQKLTYNDLATEQILYDIDEDVIIDHIKDNGLQQTKPMPTDVALENYILNNYSQNEIASSL